MVGSPGAHLPPAPAHHHERLSPFPPDVRLGYRCGRYSTTPPETITSLKAFLTTIITRLCLDQLHLARRKRELYVGAWLPEPILTATTPESADLQERVDMEESISLAFLMLLEQLQPFERAVFLLREVFEYEFAEIVTILGKSEAACRRSFSRAKKHLIEHRPRFPPSPQTHRQLLSGYFQAVQTGEMAALMELLAEEVTLWAERTHPNDFPTDGVELRYFLVVSDYARSLASSLVSTTTVRMPFVASA